MSRCRKIDLTDPVMTTKEAFLILAGWRDNNTDLIVAEILGFESDTPTARCVIVGVDHRAETVTVLYEVRTDRTGEHCFDLREARFSFDLNAADPSNTVLIVDFPSHRKIFFVES